MQKFSCCKIVRTCVMDSFRGSHRPNFLYDETFHLGISRIQKSKLHMYYYYLHKSDEKIYFQSVLSFVFFFRFTKGLHSYFLQYDPKKIITHSELYFEQGIVYIVLISLFIVRSFFDL